MTSLPKLLLNWGHSLWGYSSWLLELPEDLVVIIIFIQIQDITWLESISSSTASSFVVELFVIQLVYILKCHIPVLEDLINGQLVPHLILLHLLL